jgi:hypothetical protein
MPNWVTIAEAAELLKCTRSNVYQQIKQHNIDTEQRVVQMLRAYTTFKEVKHVDMDELNRVMQGRGTNAAR